MKNIDEEIKKKAEQLAKLGKELNQLQQVLQDKQVEALRLDGAISALKELQTEDKSKTGAQEPFVPPVGISKPSGQVTE